MICRLKEIREARGFAVAPLAKIAGVTRQTVYAIEDGTFVPNTVIALRLAHALDVAVEEIFSIETAASDTATTRADLLAANAPEPAALVRLCRVRERIVAVPAISVPAYLPAADGVIAARSRNTVSVNTALNLPESGKRLILAGCDPALSLLSDLLVSSGIEVIGVPCSSRCALDWLKRGRVHAAGSHLLDHTTGEYNVPIVKRLFRKGSVRVIAFASWEQGLVVKRGNPKQIRSIADLNRKNVAIVNREKGSGSRDVLDKGLRTAGIRASAVRGYGDIAGGHLSASHSVATGFADCCIASRSAARCFGLDFLPLTVERFDLSFSQASLDLPAGKALIDLLNRSALTRKLQAIAGYDTKCTGDVLV